MTTDQQQGNDGFCIEDIIYEEYEDGEYYDTIIYNNSLRHAPEHFKNDKEIVFASVSRDGKSLQYADERLKKDEDIVWAAINENGLALEYADKLLRNKIDFVTEAVKYGNKDNFKAFQFASDSLKKNKSFILSLLGRTKISFLEYIDICLYYHS